MGRGGGLGGGLGGGRGGGLGRVRGGGLSWGLDLGNGRIWVPFLNSLVFSWYCE